MLSKKMNNRNRIFLMGFLILGFGFDVCAKPKKVPRVPPKGSSPTSTTGRRDEGDFVIEKRSDGSTVKYKKKTTYDFEGANIDGLYNKPSGSYISNIKDVKGRSIIRIRENFDAEVADSARLIK